MQWRLRQSPYGVAATIVSVLALRASIVEVERPYGAMSPIETAWGFVASLATPIGGGLIALWLLRNANEEIARSPDRVVGEQILRVTRFVAVLAVVIALATTLFEIAVPEQPVTFTVSAPAHVGIFLD